MAFSFTGFDGVDYKIPDLPLDLMSEYEHFFIVVADNGAFRLWCFNDNILDVYFDSGFLYFEVPENSSILKFGIDNSGASFWRNYGVDSTVRMSGAKGLICCSESLMSYRDIIVTNDFTLDLLNNSNNQLSTFSLRPIIEEIQEETNIYESAYSEIFGILPVLLFVLISFIGIRKCIDYLFNLLRHS